MNKKPLIGILESIHKDGINLLKKEILKYLFMVTIWQIFVIHQTLQYIKMHAEY